MELLLAHGADVNIKNNVSNNNNIKVIDSMIWYYNYADVARVV